MSRAPRCSNSFVVVEASCIGKHAAVFDALSDLQTIFIEPGNLTAVDKKAERASFFIFNKLKSVSCLGYSTAFSG